MEIKGLDKIIKEFDFKGEFQSIDSNTCGNINDTYLLKFKSKDREEKYILQRINKEVFGDPLKLMKNIRAVTEHIRKKIIAEKGNPLRGTLTIVETKKSEDFYIDEFNNAWRVFLFIDGARTYQIVEEPRHMYTTGKALGKFQKQLSDFNVSELNETIKDFHHTHKRYIDFKRAVELDVVDRKKFVIEEVNFILEKENETKLLIEELEKGNVPLRVTHNDTKFSATCC
ncbi:MAG: hypothetical protein ACRDD2_12950 [Sarcina sp.]